VGRVVPFDSVPEPVLRVLSEEVDVGGVLKDLRVHMNRLVAAASVRGPPLPTGGLRDVTEADMDGCTVAAAIAMAERGACGVQSGSV